MLDEAYILVDTSQSPDPIKMTQISLRIDDISTVRFPSISAS